MAEYLHSDQSMKIVMGSIPADDESAARASKSSTVLDDTGGDGGWKYANIEKWKQMDSSKFAKCHKCLAKF